MPDFWLAVQEHYSTLHLSTFKYVAPVYVITPFTVLKKLLQWCVYYNNFIFMISIHWYSYIIFQATLENLNMLKASVEEIRPEGHANLTHAFMKAFQLLEKVRQNL